MNNNQYEEIFHIISDFYNDKYLLEIHKKIEFIFERISFAGIANFKDLNSKDTEALLTKLFEDVEDDNPDLLVQKIQEKHSQIFEDKEIKSFQDYFLQRIDNIVETTFVTAIALSGKHKKQVAKQLEEKVMKELRVIFEVSDEVVLGFKLIVGDKEYDNSFNSIKHISVSSIVDNLVKKIA